MSAEELPAALHLGHERRVRDVAVEHRDGDRPPALIGHHPVIDRQHVPLPVAIVAAFASGHVVPSK